jgi:hypothetical protein
MMDDLPLIEADTRPSVADLARRMLKRKGQVTAEQVEWLIKYKLGLPREDFWEFRQRMHPELITGWWPKQIARHLQIFYSDLVGVAAVVVSKTGDAGLVTEVVV